MTHAPLHPYATIKNAFWGGLRDALGTPAIVLGASMVGFGSLMQEDGWTIWHGLFSTITTWALPGQIAMVELYHAGASLFVIVLAVGLTNARLLPLTVTLFPIIRNPTTPKWVYYPLAHLVAATGWIGAMRRNPTLPREQRLPYFAGFALLLWGVSQFAFVFGFYLSRSVPLPVSLGLMFLNPLYFALLFTQDLRHRGRILSLLLGALSGPVLYKIIPDWSLLIAGLGAGTLAFAVDRALPARGPRTRSAAKADDA
ncbi:AzlC family ABC transporter permease [Varunaivibrio sulfuroxidans]|uniref:Putative branched-subunit amino acid permease n=1 Tax=Varunaivibrio sulfuroxidans TaxID=1773489 RepID=A0A4R3JC71_9PROT|nr:AzlC family ABC transporter permease [Varunaivibrio sulfuroxidans]TCS63558.1 putative branched-subunit amino acid permease [Varunaivibrio sulfuroxidans]WES30297.1 AzlC family ABC transporter permease [Varunaivibrio sulfuroxidans]